MFKRCLNSKLVDDLKSQPLYKEKLLPDIRKCVIFPAIRNGKVDFYYKGGRLFEYASNKFTSNIKYAFIPNCNKSGDIDENFLKNTVHCEKFIDGYERIKEYCAKYNEGSEAEFVSRLYKDYSYFSKNPKDSNIILLDIEASFKSSNDEKSQDRFDIVLLNKRKRTIKVVEAKLYSNNELRNFNVVKQIEGYEKVIKRDNKEITAAYKSYIKLVKDLFNIELPDFDTVESDVGLLYFDFSKPDLKLVGELTNCLKEKMPDNKIYAVGNTGGQSGASLKKLF